jgi:FtsZ-binding cell division protein ZapB
MDMDAIDNFGKLVDAIDNFGKLVDAVDAYFVQDVIETITSLHAEIAMLKRENNELAVTNARQVEEITAARALASKREAYAIELHEYHKKNFRAQRSHDFVVSRARQLALKAEIDAKTAELAAQTLSEQVRQADRFLMTVDLLGRLGKLEEEQDNAS